MTGTELYRKLNQMFSSPHNDTRDQINESIVILEDALLDEYDAEDIIDKMRVMLETLGATNFKTKLSTAILNRFWERDYAAPTKDLYRPIKIDE